MVSGQTDFHIGFISEAEQWASDNKRHVSVLGITGRKTVNNYPTLVSEGFPASFGLMNVGHHLVVPATEQRAEEFYKIFEQASQTKAVRDAYAVDYCEPIAVPYKELKNFYTFHREYWKRLSNGIKL
jgi:hypothetical protein